MQKVAIVLPTYLEATQPLIVVVGTTALLYTVTTHPDVTLVNRQHLQISRYYVENTHMTGNCQNVSLGYFELGHCDLGKREILLMGKDTGCNPL